MTEQEPRLNKIFQDAMKQLEELIGVKSNIVLPTLAKQNVRETII